MLIRRFWFYIRGYVLILVKGPNLEKFLNLAVSYGIRLWDIKRVGPDMLTCRVGVQGFKMLRPVLRKSRGSARIKRRIGLAFFIRRGTRRPTLMAGLIVFIALLYYLTGHIWFVEVTGTQKLQSRDIVATLRGIGVYPGQSKRRLEPRDVEDELLRREPQIAWAALRLKGTVAVIRVVEKEMPEADNQETASIVAARDGIIERLMIVRGYAAVAEGVTVHRGDLLISGIPPNTSNSPIGLPHVRAEGTIEARVWFQSEATVSFSETVWKRTGKKATTWELRFGGKRIHLGSLPDYGDAAKASRRRQWFPWRNGGYLVEVVRTRYYEVEKATVTVSRAQAFQKAADLAWEAIRKEMEQTRVVKTGDKTQNLKDNGNSVTAVVTVEAVAEIGSTGE